MGINRAMLPMKLHYFLFNAASGCMLPFIPVMAKSMGLSSVVVGIIYTFLPMMGMITKPTLGALADKFKIQKALFLVSIVTSMIFLFAIPWIPPLPSESKGEVHCGDSVSDLKLTSTNLDRCLGKMLDALGDNNTLNCKMNCAADAGMVEAICLFWKQPQFCAKVKNPASNHFITMTMKSAKLIDQTADNTTHTYSALPQVISFEGSLKTYKYTVIDNSLYIRLASVKFPNSNAVAPFCNNSIQKMPCLLDCGDSIVNSVFLNPSIPDSETPMLYQFWLFVLFVVLGWVGQAGCVSLSDTICFELLGDSPSKYGNQRLWGSVGWGLFSVIAGFTVDHFSKGSTKNYFPAIWIMLVIFILNIIVISTMKYEQSKSSSSILHDVGKLLAEMRILVFIVWCTLVGMGTALIWNFLFWYLEDLASAYSCDTKLWIKTLEGLVMGVQCFGGEIPLFFLSGQILKKLGHVNCMTLVLAALGVRFLLYSVLINPWLCIPIELMNGLTFGLFYATMTSYASIVALPGTASTVQGLVGAVFEGVGVSLGSFLGGLLFKHVGGRKAFELFGIAALIASAIHAIVQYIVGRRFSIIQFHERDFVQSRYASPQDAIHMLQDPHNNSALTVTT